jgi:predicted acylesterase/phospholipase RssA
VGNLALVLSGGGARGAFQAGALVELLKYFEERGKRISVLSGTSVGALNGMGIAQAATLEEARSELESNWKSLTEKDVYKIRGWGLLGLLVKFAVMPMDRWASLSGVDSLFDNSPLYRKYAGEYLRLDLIRQRRTVDQFYVSLSSLNTGEAYLKSLSDEDDPEQARRYLMASTITTVAYPPVRMVVEDPEIPPHLALVPQLYADGGISNKTPLKRILKAGGISELYVVNTYPSYPNKTEHSITSQYANVFSMLVRTALELLPNLYFLRDMEVVNDVNDDIRHLDRMKARLLEVAPDEATRIKLEAVFAEEEAGFSFKEGGKHIIDPVVIAPDEELMLQDTEFVQPKLEETFAMGREKAKERLGKMKSCKE